MELTKDSEKLICLLYKDYLRKRKSGISKSSAKSFGSSHDIHASLCPELIFEDVDNACCELSRADMLDCFWADGIAYHVELSDTCIVYMENRFKNGLAEVVDFISKLVP